MNFFLEEQGICKLLILDEGYAVFIDLINIFCSNSNTNDEW